MDDFVAIDFETANGSRTSVCSVGIVIVRGGLIIDKIYSLIRPTPNYYSWFCSEVHGLCYEDTVSSMQFREVWEHIATRIGGLPFVAHNSSFDEGCLRAVHAEYGIEYPNYEFYCTLRASQMMFGEQLPNHQLHTVSAHCGFILENHHNAMANASGVGYTIKANQNP